MASRFPGSLAALALFLMAGCGPSNTVTLQGCGATFPAPLYKRWFLEFYLQHPDVRVNYLAIGSGAGVQQFEEGLVQFGATDEALKEARLGEIAKKLSDREKRPVDVLQIPLTSGSVAMCYNIPENPNLKLSRKAYIGMLLGQVAHWDDPLIRETNSNVDLPHLEIVFIRRSDSSGTTFVFTNHLNACDPRWTKDGGGPGVGKTVQWPVGIGGKGNAGVSALIQQTPGAFGYVEAGYAELTHLPIAALENRAGNYVMPDAASSREALKEAKFNNVLGAAVADPKGAGAYPIVSFTWVICRKAYRDPRHTEELQKVLEYCLESGDEGRGQGLSSKLGYVPLPEDALKLARAAVREIQSK